MYLLANATYQQKKLKEGMLNDMRYILYYCYLKRTKFKKRVGDIQTWKDERYTRKCTGS